MRVNLIILLLAAFCLQLSANVYGQGITLEEKNANITQLLRKIENQSGYTFFFNKRDVAAVKPISISVSNVELTEALDRIFDGQPVTYQIEDKIIVVNRKPLPAPQVSREAAPLIAVVQSEITGRVTDSLGTPIEGVSVLVRGTTRGTATNVQGQFRIQAESGDVLVFRNIGFLEQQVTVNAGQTAIDVVLQGSTSALDEVVVVGFGTMRKGDLTGAITKVNIEQQTELANTNLLQSLQGLVPGFNVGATTDAGGSPNFTVRGQNTLSNSQEANEPLVVLDGIIYRGRLQDVNPANIASIEVLKDASSAAIYGSQASNGVVLITTKKGTSSKPVISYSGQYSVQNPTRNLKPLTGAASEQFLRDVYWDQSYLAPYYTEPNLNFNLESILKNDATMQNYRNGVETYWWDDLTGGANMNVHNLSVSGRGDKMRYYISGGYTGQEGFVVNERYKRYDLRANFDTDITSWLNFGMETQVASSDYSGYSPWIGDLYYLQSYAPLYNEDGSYFEQPDDIKLNPYLQTQMDDEEKRLNFFGNFHLDIKLPFLEGFNYRVNYSHNYRTDNLNQFGLYGTRSFDSDFYVFDVTGAGLKKHDYFYDWTLDHIFSYKKAVGTDHRFDATVLYGVEKRNLRHTYIKASNFADPTLGFNRLQLGSLYTVSSGAAEEQSLYMMGRLFYAYKDRYLFTGTVRRDGYSGFGSNTKIGVFPSLALGWVVSEEPFFNASFVDFLKLRGSYGTTARRAVNRYDTMARVSTNNGPAIVFGDGGTPVITRWINTMANDDLGWETTTGTNIGVDFQLFNSRLSGNVEYYNNRTKNILYPIQLPRISGFTEIATNIGQVKNHGFEFELHGGVLQRGDFSWDASVNFSAYRNRIVSILGQDLDGDGREDDLIQNGLFIGEPQSVIYDYRVEGMWQLGDEIPSGFLPGTYRLADLNGDEQITPGDDREIIGYRDPAYRFGIANTFKYKNLSLYVFINSIQGGSNFYYGDDSPHSQSLYNSAGSLSYTSVPGWDYWTPNNPDARFRRLDVQGPINARPYSQRSFVRLQDVSLAYRFQSPYLDKLNIHNLKVNISSKNLATWTDWLGWDPEMGTGLGASSPMMRSFTLGLNFEF